MEGRQTPFKPVVKQHIVDTSNDDYVLTEDHATYLKLNHKYIIPHPDVFFHSGNGIHRSSFKWNYKTREAAKQAERERIVALAKSKTDRYWAELYCDYYEVLSEFTFRPGLSPVEASRHIGRNVLKKSGRCIKVVGLMAGRWKEVLPNYLMRLEQLRREASDENLGTDDEDVKHELTDDDDYGENEARASAPFSQKPGNTPTPKPYDEDVSAYFEDTLSLADEAEKLLCRHANAARDHDVKSRHQSFITDLNEAMTLAKSHVQPNSDEARRLSAALCNMERNCNGIASQCHEYSSISDAAMSLLERFSEESKRLLNLCAWGLNAKNPLPDTLQDPNNASESELSDDCDTAQSSSKRRRLATREKVIPDAQVQRSFGNADVGEEGASVHAVPSGDNLVLEKDGGGNRSVPQLTSVRASSVTSKTPRDKKKSIKADVEWDEQDSSVEIRLGWTNPRGSMRRLLDTLEHSLRAKGIIFLDGPEGADDADEETRAKWYRAHKDEFEAAIKPIVAAFKKDVISNLFCPYCRNRQRVGNNASSAIREHWKKYHARTHKG